MRPFDFLLAGLKLLAGLIEKPAYKREMTFVLDGEVTTISNVSPQTLLVDYLHSVGKVGTKLVCGEAGCGACTVMLTSYDHVSGRLVKRAVNSCVRPLVTMDGTCVTTTQGIGNVTSALDRAQYQIAGNNGSQCGYCTPGFVMSMYTLLQNEPEPTEREVEDNFDGHICRCTGYRPILDGFRQLAKDYTPPANPPKICAELRQLAEGYKPLAYPPTDPTCLPLDDRKVKINPYVDFQPPADFGEYMRHPQPLISSVDGYTYVRPTTLEEAIKLRAANGTPFPQSKYVVGNTAVAILKTLPRYREVPADPTYLVDLSVIPELAKTSITDKGVTVGAAASITALEEILRRAVKERPEQQTRGYVAFLDHLKKVANHQVRNVGSVGGNIWLAVNGGDPSDLQIVMSALNATVDVAWRGDTATHDVDQIPQDDPKKFPGLVYVSIHIPFTAPNTHVRSYKSMFRNQNSYPVVNAAFSVTFGAGGEVASTRLFANGVATTYPKPSDLKGKDPFGLPGFDITRLSEAEAALVGAPWTEPTLLAALEKVAAGVDAHRPPDSKITVDGVPFSYRRAVCLDYFYKFFVAVALDVDPGEVSKEVESAGLPSAAGGYLHVHDGKRQIDRPISRGEQVYNEYPDELPVSLPLVKLEAFAQATGEARYTHDADQPAGTLEAAFVYSLVPRGTFHYKLPVASDVGAAGARVSAKDLTKFLAHRFDGFVDYVTYEDVPVQDRNWIGLGGDDPVFVPSADDSLPPAISAAAGDGFEPHKLTCVGAPIGLVVAVDQLLARKLAVYVRNECIEFLHESEQPLLDLDAAIEAESFFRQTPPTNPTLTHIEEIVRPGSDADWLAGGESSTSGVKTVEGTQRTGFQQHFYLETMATLAIPGENGHMTLHSSTQTLADNQTNAAAVLGVPAHQVRVLVPRDGGGFGGKQTRSAFNCSAVAVAATKLRRPVRLVLDLDTNFIMCGERHPFRGDYRVAFDDKGIIHGIDVKLYSDGGNSYDVSLPVMDLAMMLFDNGYRVDTTRINGQVARTNLISNTAFRSFGTVQAVNIAESIVERVAHETGLRPEDVRECNLYQEGSFEWREFEVTAQTVAMMDHYGVSTADLDKLRSDFIGRRFPDQVAFETALTAAGIELQMPDLRLLEEYSTKSYDFTPYMQGLMYCNLPSMWAKIRASSRFDDRARAVDEFNTANRWRKRGISMIPLKYGVAYTGPRGTLDQGGAFVIAYSIDGSVLVQHGGVEIGQGIDTKMAQIAAETLGIPLDYVRVGGTDTNVIPDASPTAASTGSDLNGGAVRKACLQLRKRLENFCEDLEQYTSYFIQLDDVEMDISQKHMVAAVVANWRQRWAEVWPMIVSLAYINRINMSAQARYRTPHYAAVDVSHPFGRPFFYFTYAIGVSEVEIDVLTGEHTILQSDILFDVGKSLNPLIDIGQVEGGFVQGVGYVTSEELLIQRGTEVAKFGYPDGAIYSYGTWKYKPPQSKSIPLRFNVELLDNSGKTLEHAGPRLDPTAVKSSKGIGEPPLVVANSVFFAIRQAVAAARKDRGHDSWFEFDAPATISRIQQACAVNEESLCLK